MALVGLTLRLLVSTTSLALLLNGAILSWADEATQQTGAQVSSLSKLEDIDWKPLWNELLTNGAESDKAGELLENLKQAFDTHEVPKEFHDEKKMIQHLIEARQPFRNESCTDDKIRTINAVKFYKLPGNLLLHQYLLDYKKGFLLNCTELIFGDLKANLKREIKDEHFEDPHRLVNELAATIGHYSKEMDKFDVARAITNLDYSDEHFTEALFYYLARQWTDREPGQSIPLASLYEEHIVEPCKVWVPATERVRGLSKHIDEHHIKWWMWKLFANGHVCKYIQDNNETILKSLHDYDEAQQSRS